MNLANCPRCGKLFAKGFNEVCPACVREIDNDYDKCATYLRANRGATIAELSEASEVSVRQITKFIREGRISMIDAPNMSYPCESCGTLIREGHICDSCRARLTKDKKNMLEDMAIRDGLANSEHNHNVYHGLNKYKDK